MTIQKSIVNNITAKMPALRIAVTPECNLFCEYCPPGGENFFDCDRPIKPEKLSKVLNICYEIGFRQFGFTGGEPLLEKRLNKIIKVLLPYKGLHLKLYTNGTLISKKSISMLKNFDLIKISLDTLDRSIYREITGQDKLQDVLRGVSLLRKNRIPLRINTVLTKRNYKEIPELTSYCYNNKASLKILDLNCFGNLGYVKWKSLYVSPKSIINFFSKSGFKHRTIYTQGHYGIAMPEFYQDGFSVRIKDTAESSVYSADCLGCKYFLCQEGIYHLTITYNGKMKICRHRSDISIDLKKIKDSDLKQEIIKFINRHFILSERTISPKQVFLGYFGKNKLCSDKK